jgi:hypothetical protein
LAVLLALQVGLGVEAWMGKFGTYTLPEQEQITPQKAAVRTAHVLVGTGILATAAALAVVVRRRPVDGSDSESRREPGAANGSFAAVLVGSTRPGGSSR